MVVDRCSFLFFMFICQDDLDLSSLLYILSGEESVEMGASPCASASIFWFLFFLCLGAEDRKSVV